MQKHVYNIGLSHEIRESKTIFRTEFDGSDNESAWNLSVERNVRKIEHTRVGCGLSSRTKDQFE